MAFVRGRLPWSTKKIWVRSKGPGCIKGSVQDERQTLEKIDPPSGWLALQRHREIVKIAIRAALCLFPHTRRDLCRRTQTAGSTDGDSPTNSPTSILAETTEVCCSTLAKAGLALRESWLCPTGKACRLNSSYRAPTPLSEPRANSFDRASHEKAAA
jgi:hypothetical protein